MMNVTESVGNSDDDQEEEVETMKTFLFDVERVSLRYTKALRHYTSNP